MYITKKILYQVVTAAHCVETVVDADSISVRTQFDLNYPARAPAGLKSQGARAVAGRRCPHSGVGEDFLPRRTGPLTKTDVTRKRKVEKSFRRCQNNRNAYGYLHLFDKNRGPIAKYSGRNPDFYLFPNFVDLVP